nr:immunoglobulin light chain junction region [Macaca mulatta]MOW05531.1 immunoglobulin light chain junction region [Macaca mulatta]MOW06152.1 immunoglobulin light chain junction region [Macaca mulatta]MOW06442.1 immunoglobulin light chain junction region [Macaca mulatta]MOW66212.1 immunoglobulin light chain junction region [Macaca mulatta]
DYYCAIWHSSASALF